MANQCARREILSWCQWVAHFVLVSMGSPITRWSLRKMLNFSPGKYIGLFMFRYNVWKKNRLALRLRWGHTHDQSGGFFEYIYARLERPFSIFRKNWPDHPAARFWKLHWNSSGLRISTLVHTQDEKPVVYGRAFQNFSNRVCHEGGLLTIRIQPLEHIAGSVHMNVFDTGMVRALRISFF